MSIDYHLNLNIDIQSKIYSIDHTFTSDSVCNFLQNLSKESGISFVRLFVMFGGRCLAEGEKLRFLLYLDDLSLSDRYDILVEACSISHIKVFYAMDSSLGDGEFFDYVKEKMDDDNPICQYIREIYSEYNTTIFQLEDSGNLQKLLFDNPGKMLRTLEHILQVAIQVENYNIIIRLGSCFPKKRILKILTSADDSSLIDKFFSLYKKDPQIKKLTPFI